ncbi:MAG TPA: ABC transporter substrate-binding protein [Xanthobacteraceae bacterium]|nr:ABC transporter substrate-binding protein [Xanthobacteraceae bacterium]
MNSQRRTWIKRGLAALGAAAFATALALPQQTMAADLQKVRVSIIPINDVTPLFAAMKQGYFAEEGLEIDTTPSAGGATGIPGLIAGSFDIVYGNVVSMLLAAQQGIDIRVAAPGTKIDTPEFDMSAMVVRADSGIKTGRDLEGKSVGVNTRNNVIWLYARAWIKATGGDPDRVTYREVPHPQMEDALRQKQVDAGYMVIPYVAIATQKPEFQAIAHPYSKVQLGVDVGQYLTTAKFLSDKPETVTKFVRALRRGIEWYNANRGTDDLLKIVSGFTRLDVEVLRKVKMSPAPLKVDPPQIETTMKLMIEHRLLRGPIDVKPLIAAQAL